MKNLFVAICMLLGAVAAHATEPAPEITVTLKDGTRQECTLLKSWVAKGKLNREFQVRLPDGTEKWLNSSEVDSITVPGMNLRYAVHGFKDRKEQWIMRCGPSTENAEILTYAMYANTGTGAPGPMFSRWENSYVHAIRFKGDSVVHPFYFHMMGGLYLKFMKKHLKDSHPGLMKHIEAYFKENKDRKKSLAEHPEYFLDAYEDFLRQGAPE